MSRCVSCWTNGTGEHHVVAGRSAVGGAVDRKAGVSTWRGRSATWSARLPLRRASLMRTRSWQITWRGPVSRSSASRPPDLAAHPDFTAPFLPGLHPPRPSLRATRIGDAGGRTVLFYAHVDVVPQAGHQEPWSGRYDGTGVHGRGSVDTKNNVGDAGRGDPLPGPAEPAGPGGSSAGHGSATRRRAANGALSAVLHGRDFDEVVMLEPTSLQVMHGHRGCLSFTVTAEAAEGHLQIAQPGRQPGGGMLRRDHPAAPARRPLA